MGPGSRGTGYGVPGCGKRRVWKTRDLVENAGSGGKREVPFFSPKYEFSSLEREARTFFSLYCDEYF